MFRIFAVRLLPMVHAYVPDSSEVDHYPVCGLMIDRDGVVFCSHYGDILLSAVERDSQPLNSVTGSRMYLLKPVTLPRGINPEILPMRYPAHE